MLKILVADDSLSIRKMAENCLKNAGYEVVLAEDGQEAFEILKSEGNFGAVITDFHMPKMNGIELMQAMQSDDQLRTIPRIMLTTESDVETMNKARSAGARGWLVKPFDKSQLITLMKHLVPQ